MQTYNITLTGKTALIHHWDNIEWSDQMDAWKADPNNKKGSKAGDDRSPAFRWLGALYHNGTVVAMPQDNIMRCLMEGAALVPVPGGKSGKTFKAQSQSGMLVGEPFWPQSVTSNGAKSHTIPVAPLLALQTEKSFAKHQETARRLGFELFLKRAKIGQSKHVRVRPMFEKWSLAGTIHVWDEQITKGVLADILSFAGTYKGLGDWRPSGKTPGPYGTFAATIDG